MRGGRIDFVKCLEYYYKLHEIGIKEISEMFNICRSKASQMKSDVRAEQLRRNILCFNPVCVNTELAFELWGIDIAEVEKRVTKLKKLGMIES